MFNPAIAIARDWSIGLVVDNFAGGGGASTGIEAALQRDVDVAINHDDEAVAMHAANHPRTRHHCQSIYSVDPLEAVTIDGRARPIWLAWFSPDCKDFSKAKGGKPVSKNIRSLAWVVVHWVDRLGAALKPAIIKVENVEEFLEWGPLDADNKRIPERKGEIFKQWVAALRKRGYVVEWRVIKACDVGAPTIRKRLCLTARCDGLPIVWPIASHGPGRSKPYRTAAECIDWSLPCPSIFLTREQGRAIGVKRPLADATMARIARGIQRYVIDAPTPFIVNLTHQGGDRLESVDEPFRTVTGANRGEKAIVVPIVSYAQQGGASRDVLDPMHTITASPKDQNTVLAAVLSKFATGNDATAPDEPTQTIEGTSKQAVLAATMVQMGYGEREGQAPRALDVDAPLGTVVAGGIKHAVVAAHLTKFRTGSTGQGLEEPMHTVTSNSFIKRPGGAPPFAVVAAFLAQHNTMPNGGVHPGHSAETPLSTTTAKGCQQAIVAAHMVNLKGSDRRMSPADGPAPAVCAGGFHVAEVRAFLMKYYGTDQDPQLEGPLHTITTKDRFAIVMVKGEPYQIVDIGMRMLTPRELANAQGFPADYIIAAPGPDEKPLTKTAQVRMIGNSVCPPLAEALVRASCGKPLVERLAA